MHVVEGGGEYVLEIEATCSWHENEGCALDIQIPNASPLLEREKKVESFFARTIQQHTLFIFPLYKE